jgi:hypothetical protein
LLVNTLELIKQKTNGDTCCRRISTVASLACTAGLMTLLMANNLLANKKNGHYYALNFIHRPGTPFLEIERW